MKKKSTTPKTKAPKSSKKELSFEDSLRELQKIVQQLEQGELGLSESLDSYESGVQHLNQCYRQLAKAEQKVELLREVAEDGSSVTEPFEEDSMSLEEKAAARGARRRQPLVRRALRWHPARGPQALRRPRERVVALRDGQLRHGALRLQLGPADTQARRLPTLRHLRQQVRDHRSRGRALSTRKRLHSVGPGRSLPEAGQDLRHAGQPLRRLHLPLRLIQKVDGELKGAAMYIGFG